MLKQRALRELRRACYAGFGPTLASEHLAQRGVRVSRETLRRWMSQAQLWQPRTASQSGPCVETEAIGFR